MGGCPSLRLIIIIIICLSLMADGVNAGRRIVEMVKENLRPSDILTKKAFENAIRVNGAIGGSTNAVLHLLSISRRVRPR